MKGLKMGGNKLVVNVARFAAENLPPQRQTVAPVGQDGGRFRSTGQFGVEEGTKKFNQRDSRTTAFEDLYGLAVVGRTADLETLVDFDKLLKIASYPYTKIQYLGGLSILISFDDKGSAERFLDSKDIWGPWFSKLDAWEGQCLPLERVVWLKLLGIPLHLLDSDVLGRIGEMFGRILHVPKCLMEDQDLSVFRVGVLTREAQRINHMILLKWRDRCFRVWLEEELEVWLPDCFENEGCNVENVSDCSSPLNSSLVAEMSVSGTELPEKGKRHENGDKCPGSSFLGTSAARINVVIGDDSSGNVQNIASPMHKLRLT
ncbi:hypothetical protein HanPSC8_Chr15g0683221 [Helianthus annuus]|nr:hypothetical protein HanPSC8_Chr15g0683221 [Helianthus annuus]